MNRSPALASLRAFVALAVTLLQLLGALHFSLVQHSYSAALGGVVHVHTAPLARAQAEAAPRLRGAGAPTVTSGSPACSADRCAAADAPHSAPPEFAAWDAGAVRFGDARLLRERAARSFALRVVLLGAPKTSPPV